MSSSDESEDSDFNSVEIPKAKKRKSASEKPPGENEWTFDEIYSVCSSQQTAVDTLQKLGLLARSAPCGGCGQELKLYKCKKSPDGFGWRCNRVSYDRRNKRKKRVMCFFSQTIRKGSWFEKSNFDMKTVLRFTYMWSRNYSFKDILHECRAVTKTGLDWTNSCREVVAHFFTFEENRKIGGPGLTVEIGERKIKDQWVLGGVESETGRCFLYPLLERNADTLGSLIVAHVKSNSDVVVVNDFWKDYLDSTEKQEQFVAYLLKANHSVDFQRKIVVGFGPRPANNSVEGTWRKLKEYMPIRFRKDEKINRLEGHLQKFMFHRQAIAEKCSFFALMLKAICIMYKVNP